MRFKLYDVVRLNRPVPEKSISAGSQGAIVQVYEQGDGPEYLVEFCDDEGRTLALATLEEDALRAAD